MRIWEISGPGWVLPVSYSDGGEIGFVVPMLNCQKELIHQVVEEYGWCVGERMFMERERIRLVGVESTQVDPEQCVHWTPSQREITESPVVSEEEHLFLEAWCQQGWERSIERAAIIWSSLCRHMLDWTLIKGNRLDLKFMRVEMFPFRPQWKMLALARLTRSETESIGEREIQLKLLEILKDPRLMMTISERPRMGWSISVEETDWFHENCRKIERDYGALHGASYWTIARQRLKNLLPKAIESILEFVRQADRPFPELDQSGKHCPPDRARRGGVQGKSQKSEAARPIRVSATGVREESGCIVLDPKEKDLSELRDI